MFSFQSFYCACEYTINLKLSKVYLSQNSEKKANKRERAIRIASYDYICKHMAMSADLVRVVKKKINRYAKFIYEVFNI